MHGGEEARARFALVARIFRTTTLGSPEASTELKSRKIDAGECGSGRRRASRVRSPYRMA